MKDKDKIVLPSRETVLRVALEVSERAIANANKESNVTRTAKTPRPLAPNERFATCQEWQVDCARKALNAHQEVMGKKPEPMTDTALLSLLCNLMHLCDEDGVDFEKTLNEARESYELEVTK